MSRAIALLALGAVCFSAAAFAAAPAPKPPAELAVARKAYVAAIRAKDWKALAALVNFPVAIDNYGSPPTVTKAAFLKDHRQVFLVDDPDQLKCQESTPATYQGTKSDFGYGAWLVECDGSDYFFGQHGGRWLFTAYQNVNE